jgi:hypothetical protein
MVHRAQPARRVRQGQTVQPAPKGPRALKDPRAMTARKALWGLQDRRDPQGHRDPPGLKALPGLKGPRDRPVRRDLRVPPAHKDPLRQR